MRIYFGLTFDDLVYPLPTTTAGGVRYVGPQGLLHLLEAYLGLSGHPNNIEFLRIEQYRQALGALLEQQPQAFFAASYRADQFAAATELLSRRDELLLGGWDFHPEAPCPERLQTLADVEALFRTPEHNLHLAAGYAERFCEVLENLNSGRHPIREVYHNEPLDLLPFHYQRLFRLLDRDGVLVQAIPPLPTNGDQTDLDLLKQRLLAPTGRKEKKQLRADGSLLILKGKRDTPLAHFLARLIRKNADFRPLCIIPEKNRSLDHALIQEGLPSLGILTASLSRPTIQVLKLAPVFLWRPIDPYKIMEFISLAVKPLDDELANRLAHRMAESPGLQSDSWYGIVNQYLDELRSRPPFGEKRIDPDEVERQYRFWFERKRYDSTGTAPKEEILLIYQRVSEWARKVFEEEGAINSSLLLLSEQAKRICELLEALPETQLTYLELERIVRTIYEPAPIQLQPREKGRLPHVFHPQSVFGPAPRVLWWNFIQNEPAYFFARWYQSEQTYLNQRQIFLLSPQQQNQLLVWQRKRPMLAAQEQLILVIPEVVAGVSKNPHPLYGDLQAAFRNLETVTFDIDHPTAVEKLDRFFQLPTRHPMTYRRLGRPKAFIRIDNNAALQEREDETMSSLENLLYYPYQWVFRHKIKLKKSSILSIVNDYTLMGNLAHRLFERLLREDVLDWDRAALRRWIDREAPPLLRREGAILLMYGREPERINFIKRVEFAAWSLINMIRDNDWNIVSTEQPLEASFLHTPINGRADLILRRGNERAIIDLKWRGATRRERLIRNEEDLQLILYAHLLKDSDDWPHTAYFIMENGKMIARNQLAFNNCVSVASDANHSEINQRILARMEATYRWRLQQIQSGRIEVRCTHTLEELEEYYGAELLEVLEMKTEDAYFDDYRTLINLIE